MAPSKAKCAARRTLPIHGLISKGFRLKADPLVTSRSVVPCLIKGHLNHSIPMPTGIPTEITFLHRRLCRHRQRLRKSDLDESSSLPRALRLAAQECPDLARNFLGNLKRRQMAGLSDDCHPGGRDVWEQLTFERLDLFYPVVFTAQD